MHTTLYQTSNLKQDCTYFVDTCRQLFNNGSDYLKTAPEYTTVASENLVCSICTRGDDWAGNDPVAGRRGSAVQVVMMTTSLNCCTCRQQHGDYHIQSEAPPLHCLHPQLAGSTQETRV